MSTIAEVYNFGNIDLSNDTLYNNQANITVSTPDGIRIGHGSGATANPRHLLHNIYATDISFEKLTFRATLTGKSTGGRNISGETVTISGQNIRFIYYDSSLNNIRQFATLNNAYNSILFNGTTKLTESFHNVALFNIIDVDGSGSWEIQTSTSGATRFYGLKIKKIGVDLSTQCVDPSQTIQRLSAPGYGTGFPDVICSRNIRCVPTSNQTQIATLTFKLKLKNVRPQSFIPDISSTSSITVTSVQAIKITRVFYKDLSNINTYTALNVSPSNLQMYDVSGDGYTVPETVKNFCMRYFTKASNPNPNAKVTLPEAFVLDVSNIGLLIRCDKIDDKVGLSSIGTLQYAKHDALNNFIDISYDANRSAITLPNNALLRYKSEEVLDASNNTNNTLDFAKHFKFGFQIWTQYTNTPYSIIQYSNYANMPQFSEEDYPFEASIAAFYRPYSLKTDISDFIIRTNINTVQSFTVNDLWTALQAVKSPLSGLEKKAIIITNTTTDVSGTGTIQWISPIVNNETNMLEDKYSVDPTINLSAELVGGYQSTETKLISHEPISLLISGDVWTLANSNNLPTLTFRLYDGRIYENFNPNVALPYSEQEYKICIRINKLPSFSKTDNNLFIIAPIKGNSHAFTTQQIFDLFGGNDDNKDVLVFKTSGSGNDTNVQFKFSTDGNNWTAITGSDSLKINSTIQIRAEYIGNSPTYTSLDTSTYPFIQLYVIDPYDASSNVITLRTRIQSPPQFSEADPSSIRLRTIPITYLELTKNVSTYNVSGLLQTFFPDLSDLNTNADIKGIYVEDISASVPLNVYKNISDISIDISRSNLLDVNRFISNSDSIYINYSGTSISETIWIGIRLYDGSIDLSDISATTIQNPGQGISGLSAIKKYLRINSSSIQNTLTSTSNNANMIVGPIPSNKYLLNEKYILNSSDPNYIDSSGFSIASLLNNTVQPQIDKFKGIILDGSATKIRVESTTALTEAYTSTINVLDNKELGKFQYKPTIDSSWIDLSSTARGLLLDISAYIRFNPSQYKITNNIANQPYITYRPFTGATDKTAKTGDYLLEELYWMEQYNISQIGTNIYTSIYPVYITKLSIPINPQLINESFITDINTTEGTLNTSIVINNYFPAAYAQQISFAEDFKSTLLTNFPGELETGTRIFDISYNKSDFSGSSFNELVFTITSNNINLLTSNNTTSLSTGYNNSIIELLSAYRKFTINSRKILSYKSYNIDFIINQSNPIKSYTINNKYDISFQNDLQPVSTGETEQSFNLSTRIQYTVDREGNSDGFKFSDFFNYPQTNGRDVGAFPALSLNNYGIALSSIRPQYSETGYGLWVAKNVKNVVGNDISQTILDSSFNYLLLGEDAGVISNPLILTFNKGSGVLTNDFTLEMKFRIWNRRVGDIGAVFNATDPFDPTIEKVGPGTPFSSTLYTAYLRVIVNRQPEFNVLQPIVYLNDVYEDQPTADVQSYSVSQIYSLYPDASENITDADLGTYQLLGMVITDMSDAGVGRWYYSTNNNNNNNSQYNPIPIVPLETAAKFHLNPDFSIRFQPADAPNKFQDISSAAPYINFRLWDRGNNGAVSQAGYYYPVVYDGSGPNYSAGVGTVRILVRPTNDAPTAVTPTGTILKLPEILSTDSDPSGISISTLLTTNLSGVTDIDVSGITTLGIVIYMDSTVTGNDNGKWQYDVGDGSWNDLSDDLPMTSALLLPHAGKLRFFSQVGEKPVGDGSIIFHLWDGTIGTAGQIYDILTNFFNLDGTLRIDLSYNQPPISLQKYNLTQPIEFINTRPNLSLITATESVSIDGNIVVKEFTEGTELSINSTQLTSYINVNDIDVLNGQYIGLALFKIIVTPGYSTGLNISDVAVSYIRPSTTGSANINIPLLDVSLGNAFHFRCDDTNQFKNDSKIYMSALGTQFYGSITLRFFGWDGYNEIKPGVNTIYFEQKKSIDLSEIDGVFIPSDTTYSNNFVDIIYNIIPEQDRPVVTVSTIGVDDYIRYSIEEDVINPTFYTIPSIIRRFELSGVYIDADPENQRGICIIAISGDCPGNWEYTNNISDILPVWTTMNISRPAGLKRFLSVTDVSAALRFKPAANAFGKSVLEFLAYDGTDISGGQPLTSPFDSASIRNSNNAYSVGSMFLEVTVTDVNDAPILAETDITRITQIASYDEDTSGQLIGPSHIFNHMGTNTYTDIDPNSIRGIYIFGFNKSISGEWYYSDNSGSTWSVITGPIRMKESELNKFIRFEPGANANSDNAASFSIYAWDTTDELAPIDPFIESNRGGITPYSINSITFTIRVVPINDAPIILGPQQDGSVQFTYNVPSIYESGIENEIIIECSTIITSLKESGKYVDIDASATLGIAVMDVSANKNGLGTWLYRTSDTAEIVSLNPRTIDGLNIQLITLNNSGKLIFRQSPKQNGRCKITFLAWDETPGSQINWGPVSNLWTQLYNDKQGGSTAFSINRGEIVLDIISVNDPALFTSPNNIYTIGAFNRGSSSDAVTVSTLLNYFGFADEDSADFLFSMRAAIVADISNNPSIGGEWYAVSGETEMPLITNMQLYENYSIYYKGASIIPIWPQNRLTSFTILPYDGSGTPLQTQKRFITTTIRNVQPTIASPLQYDLSSVRQLTTAKTFTVEPLFKILEDNSSAIIFSGNKSSIGLVLYYNGIMRSNDNDPDKKYKVNENSPMPLQWRRRAENDGSYNLLEVGTYDFGINRLNRTEFIITMNPTTTTKNIPDISEVLQFYMYDICDNVPNINTIDQFTNGINVVQTVLAAITNNQLPTEIKSFFAKATVSAPPLEPIINELDNTTKSVTIKLKNTATTTDFSSENGNPDPTDAILAVPEVSILQEVRETTLNSGIKISIRQLVASDF